jgi:hypothetical protein
MKSDKFPWIPKRLQAVAPADAVEGKKFVCTVPYYWSAGDTLAEALANLRKVGGGSGASGRLLIYLVPESFEVSPIDGRISWRGSQKDGVLLFDGRRKKDLNRGER